MVILEDSFSIYSMSVDAPVLRHNHDFLELFYVCKGWAEHTLNGKTMTLKEGDYLILDYGEEHSFDLVGGGLTVINCLFRPSMVDGSLRGCRSFQGILDHYLVGIGFAFGGLGQYDKVFFDEKGEIRNLLERMLLEIQQKNLGWQPMLRAELLEVIIRTMRLKEVRQASAIREASEGISWMMEQIRAEPSAEHRLCRYASQLGMRAQALGPLFKKTAGCSFNAYVRVRRMELACRLLCNTSRPIPLVLESCGYADEKSFRDAFVKTVGEGPCHYRARMRQAEGGALPDGRS